MTVLPPATERKPDARAADSVVAALEQRIFAGHLKSGDRLPAERELCQEFAVSRTVAREAVQILGGKGLLDLRPQYRPVVRAPNYEAAAGLLGGLVNHLIARADGVAFLFETRIFIEAGLARQAALEGNKEHIAALRAALAQNGAQINDSQKFYQTDMAFHAVLYTVPNNPIFPALHRAFCDWLSAHWQKMPRLPQRNQRNYEAHEAILEAILDRDPDLAEMRLRGHLQDAWRQVCETFS